MPRSGKRKHDDDDDDDDDNLLDEDDSFGEPMFSQLPPEASQSVKPETESHRKNLDNLNREAQEKHLVSISRLILFRGLEKEPIDRLKVTKDAGIAGKDNIGSAAFQEASRRLHNVFGFELNKIPKVNLISFVRCVCVCRCRCRCRCCFFDHGEIQLTYFVFLSLLLLLLLEKNPYPVHGKPKRDAT
jgi:hypothetical protein